MASLYPRNDSPYLWLKFIDKDGRVKQTSTKCRREVPPELRRARRMEAEKTAIELSYGERPRMNTDWQWVRDFLKVRYHSSPATYERYSCSWETIELYLKEKKIISPAHLQRQHCFDYVSWRQTPKTDGRYRAGHNTAVLELKILRIIMREAVERSLCAANPCVQLGIKKTATKPKPEFTNEHCDLILSCVAKVEAHREFLEISFSIARYQGCRIAETRLNPQTDVDIERKTIIFRAKGGKDFMTALHPVLIPLFTRLRAEGRTSTWDPPQGAPRQWPSIIWSKFIRRFELKKKIGDGACFHSTRVTIVTRLARSGVPISKAKRYVGHASTTVHEIYQRLQHDDLQGCTDAVI